MDTALQPQIILPQDAPLRAVVAREGARLRNFVRQRVPNPADADDVAQDVLQELVDAWRLPEPIEQVGAWLLRVARNRIIDRFRKKKELPLPAVQEDDGEWLEDLLPDPGAGPEAEYARSVLLAEIEAALDELPAEQRAVFVAHEIDGLSFRELSEQTGVNINTLLARKRYAVAHLRERLVGAYAEWND
jgi:RNA polymerase sigma factor (sigma-70 family)